MLVVRDAVAGHDEDAHVNFPFSAFLVRSSITSANFSETLFVTVLANSNSQASYVGVLLYFLAGLLPNPDGPWSPTYSHCHAWITAVLLEAVIAAVFVAEKRAIGVQNDLLETLSGLGLARIVVLGVMIAFVVVRELKLKRSAPKSTPEERQSLLENGQESVPDYGAAPAHGHGAHPPIKPASGKPPGVQNTGWLDYFAGFRVLFPYLWFVKSSLESQSTKSL